MKKYYYFSIFESAYDHHYATALDYHPLIWIKDQFKAGENPTLMAWQEITEQEYSLYLEALENMPT